MKNAVPVSAIALEMDEQDSAPGQTLKSSLQPWSEVLSIVLLACAVFVGIDFWRDWFSSLDRVICSACLILGWIVAFSRSTWEGEQTRSRIIFAGLLFSLAAIFIGSSYYLAQPKLSGIACGLILAGWCSIRILGESYQHSFSLGLGFVIPSGIDALAARGAFHWLGSMAISVTSGLADLAEQANVREGEKLIFGQGVADQFSSLGNWDSVLSLFGVAVFCILSFRRNFLQGVVAIAMSALVWIAVRGSAWAVLIWLGNRNGIWYNWSLGLAIGLFVLGAVLVVSIDQYFSALLEPIPFEFINLDFPLFAMIWNWLCGLPKLTVTVPQREEFAQDDLDA